MSYLPSLQTQFGAVVSHTPRIVALQVRDRVDVDRKLATVIVEAVEERRLDEAGAAWSASLTLHFERIAPEGDRHLRAGSHFAAGYSAQRNCVSLLSSSADGGALFLDLPGLEGQRIGTYLMDRLVEWAKQWPTASVNVIGLDRGQAGPDNKERRNRFYERYGFMFDYDDPSTRESGRSRALTVADLRLAGTWRQNIDEMRLDQYLAKVLHEGEHAASELFHRDRAVRELIAEARARERRPLRWAIGWTFTVWWQRLLPWALAVGLVSLAAWNYVRR